MRVSPEKLPMVEEEASSLSNAIDLSRLNLTALLANDDNRLMRAEQPPPPNRRIEDGLPDVAEDQDESQSYSSGSGRVYGVYRLRGSISRLSPLLVSVS